MKKLLFVFLFLSISSTAFGQSASEVVSTLQAEWSRFRTLVDTLTPDGEIGGYMQYVEYEDVTLLWRVSDDASDNEVIRFFIDREGHQSFAVTYHRSHHIIPGQTVIRRFLGGEPTGWINHTIDYNTGEYLGRQGSFPYNLRANEMKMLENWEIKLLGKNP